MTTLQDVKQAVARLSPAELKELRAFIDQQVTRETGPPTLQVGTMNIDALTATAREIRAEMGEENWSEAVDAMNEDYIEPTNDDGLPQL